MWLLLSFLSIRVHQIVLALFRLSSLSSVSSINALCLLLLLCAADIDLWFYIKEKMKKWWKSITFWHVVDIELYLLEIYVFNYHIFIKPSLTTIDQILVIDLHNSWMIRKEASMELFNGWDGINTYVYANLLFCG